MQRTMLQLNQVEFLRIIKCQNCMEIFKIPITMPCGATICQDCLSKLQSNHTNCKFCGKQHETEGTFPVNNSIKLILNLYKASKDNVSEQHYDNFTNLKFSDVNNERVSLPANLKTADEQRIVRNDQNSEINIYDNVKSM